jgi:hypothetical protein
VRSLSSNNLTSAAGNHFFCAGTDCLSFDTGAVSLRASGENYLVKDDMPQDCVAPRCDRRHYVRELRAAEQAHRDLPAKVEEAYRAAHRLACQEWSVRQFIGGPAEPSPRIADAIAGGCELLEGPLPAVQP